MALYNLFNTINIVLQLKPELHLKESDYKMINLKITTEKKNAISEEQQYFPENVIQEVAGFQKLFFCTHLYIAIYFNNLFPLFTNHTHDNVDVIYMIVWCIYFAYLKC